REPLEGPVLAGATLRVNDVPAVLPLPDELQADLGRVLQIRVHDDDRVPEGVVDAGGDGDLVPEVAGQVDDRDAVVAPGQLDEAVERAVRAAVVDEDELDVDVDRGDSRTDPLVEQIDVAFLAVDRQDVRDQRA